jgi:hypothetical protein
VLIGDRPAAVAIDAAGSIVLTSDAGPAVPDAELTFQASPS